MACICVLTASTVPAEQVCLDTPVLASMSERAFGAAALRGPTIHPPPAGLEARVSAVVQKQPAPASHASSCRLVGEQVLPSALSVRFGLTDL